MLWIWLVPIVLLAAGLLWWWGAQPVRHRATLREFLDRHVPNFLERMAPGTILTAERANAPGFLQLVLLTTAGTNHDVEFGLPDDTWSRSAFDALATGLRTRGFHLTVEDNTAPGIARFLRVRVFGAASELVVQLSTLLETTVSTLGWESNQNYVVTYRGSLRRAA